MSHLVAVVLLGVVAIAELGRIVWTRSTKADRWDALILGAGAVVLIVWALA